MRGMAKKRAKWIKARTDAHVSQFEAAVAVCSSRIPKRCWIDGARLSRFENGGPARIDPLALGVLARAYGQDLAAIDPEAAAELAKVGEEIALVLAGTPPDDGPENRLTEIAQIAHAA